ncbi:exonuclease [Gardnerella vaginalis]|nr:exonuclease [Gardnerella vaginalis]
MKEVLFMSNSNSNYTKQLIDDYCVLDTETTGLSAYYDEIIEIGILRVRNNEIVDRYDQLIKPNFDIDDFITALTGITNDMLEGMPSIDSVKTDVLSFIGDDIILGHNTSFDMRFLNEGFKEQLSNQYMDTMQFARKLYPELKHHRLSDLTDYLGLHNNEHRALSDCTSTKELYDAVKASMAEKNLAIEDLWIAGESHGGKGIDIKAIKPTEAVIDEDGFFYNRHVVFTGKLEKMLRKDAMQIVVNLGGVLDNSVNKQTNYLILGDNDYNAILKGEKSSKHKKAEKLKLEGQDIEIIDERTFYDLLNV